MRNYKSKDTEKNLDIFLGSLCLAAIATPLYGSIAYAAIDYAKRQNDIHTYTSIVVSDDNITINDKNEYKGIQKDDYAIIDNSSESLVINLYYKDPAKRFMYKEYILNNINIEKNEDGTYSIKFDPNSLTEENYKEFAENYEGQSSISGTQRIRG